MTPMTFRYPNWPRINRAVEAAVFALVVVGGVKFILTTPPDTPRVWVILCGAMAAMTWYAYFNAKIAIHLSDSLQISEVGVTYSQLGKSPVSIPWPEVRKIRNHGKRGDLIIEVEHQPRPIHVHHWLIGLDEFKAALVERVGPWGKVGSGNRSREGLA
jgi:hypothetical protein